MAGGATTPELVAAVSEAGALGAIGGAMLSPDALREAIRAVRGLTDRPFGVNLFAPMPPAPASAEQRAAVNRVLAPFREELGLPEPAPPSSPPAPYEAQLAVVVEERVPVFSFTFGLPDLAPIRETGAVVAGTATTVAEAIALEAAGVDIVVTQGSEAGGHRGTFLGAFEGSLVGGLALVPQVVDRVGVPVVAAGGIMDGRGIAAALALGAEGAQLGTAFLGADESGVPPMYKHALRTSSDDSTLVTNVYTGRHARAIRTPLIDELERSEAEPLPYPLQGMLLGDIRSAGVERDRSELLFLLAGQGSALTRELPAGELVAALVKETAATIRRLAHPSGEE